ncbi:hypothetical protein FHT39_001397 [Mitsuaria sp. BK045]|uniref:hypothetical protein n=1 Tax=unclassified Roseateles TaxID=2626991 RepID=UPI00160D91B1|nr:MULTISPECIES: hypothetical protein [unclassified Roseateles]MBB3292758.1 hypothetical protein [Mitsuaria sp. BK041]MBB3361975.1 hypothetical protein [Mitsuaria sp. BK045]
MRSADALGRVLRANLASILQEAGQLYIKDLQFEDSLKTRILEDPLFCIQAISNDSFKVVALPHDVCRSIVRDYYFGYERVKAQWESTTVLVNEGKVAWAVVSAYYCSFFAAIEALRLCRSHALSLTSDEARTVCGKMAGPYVAKLFERRNFKGVISADYSEIGYTSSGERPHQAAWRLLNDQVLPSVPKSSAAWLEILKFSNMCEGRGGWEIPSDIRNRWNYRDSAYFGNHGRISSNPFLKLIREESAASSWIRGQVGVRSENDAAASMGALAKLLHLAICDSFDYGFMSSRNVLG